MSTSANAVPHGMRNLTPQIVTKDAKAFIDFCQRAFGAETQQLMPGPGGGVMHANIRIGDSALFVSDASDFAKPTTANLFLYVNDVDAAYDKAVKEGATAAAPVSDMFWGDRWGMVADPYGNIWQLATHKEDVSPEEMKKRMQQAAAG